ncbi:putative mitochondrial amino acid permease (AAT1.1) [Leptomonas pyrrhocoris]|uniref:Putative mitochondrial amino acid permease (AAT1.1) n=1 Tax=Leptomonas pyrrhocoris TaxID=157538 RepID=A0A0N1J4N9_LEPPY|nr:putative mitochondrial amino acid permease (AAT1.1) [Leptomonas pyrrhocoris]XP_015657263.1 putative mitochondrial amino acid permease (AAT1.1) [Leptomonas pyrrhocoris]KPA78823.1 putative mitochondrial amino acid permease (AAT1.1) [Leptomonas pyrrhocoris]KPA78824.1 putative mitochondrial amino acid permease (AAT1.1) [Leptomonas pyrrhocoris]|eukprot:XP_015657262.1 putative mitochondrial amino acid permease (AAT1.1) [Leptomonas pyrrhocoris]
MSHQASNRHAPDVQSYAPQREEYSDRASGSIAQGNMNTYTATTTTARREKHHAHKHSRSQRRGGCGGVFQCLGQAALRVVHTIVPPGGILSGAFNMASGSIGAGILGLPSAGDSAGLVLGVIYLVIITYFSVFSMYILALAAQSTRIKSFEGMARWLFPYGNYAFSYWAAFIRWFHAFAGCVAYIISVGNCLGPIFDDAKKRHPGNSAIEFFATTQGLRVLTVVIWACIMLPMVVPKHIDSLRYASAFAITFMVYFVIVVVIHSCRHGLPENAKYVMLSGNEKDDAELTVNAVFLFRTGNSVIHSVGVFMFAYVCQVNAYEIFWDFRPEIRTTKNYTWSALIGMLICGTLYILVCVFGYFDFGSENLLGKSLLLMYHPLEEADVMIAYVGVMIKLCVAYALLTIAARNSIYYMIGFQHRYRNRPDAAVTSPVGSEELAAQRSSGDDVVAKPAGASAAGNAVVDQDLDDGLAEAGCGVPTGKKTVSQDVADEVAANEVDRDFEDNTTEDTTYIDNIPFWKHLIVVLSLSAASLLCGLFIPNINTVFGFAGAISGGFLAFVFPALFFMYSGNFSVAQVGWFTYLNTYILLLCGVVGIVFGTGGTIYATI